MKKHIKKIIIAITGISILTAGIYFKQEFFLMIPLFVSLVVMFFQSEANRLGPLLGGINSLIYTAAYLYLGIYLSAVSAVLFSFPFQIITFIRWSKNAYKKTAVFKKMTTKARVLGAIGFFAAWAVLIVVFNYLDAASEQFNYDYVVLDSAQFLLGLAVQTLTMLAYIEYTYLWLVQIIVGLFLNVQMIIIDPAQTTYFIYGIYATYCVILAFINVQKFYKEQQAAAN
ncbi:MAG: nicotinamide mononucleotide transporter [Clostridia bacterium]|nr:nicotinamide mononucleotide transporter [Clostridia bacterium]